MEKKLIMAKMPLMVNQVLLASIWLITIYWNLIGCSCEISSFETNREIGMAKSIKLKAKSITLRPDTFN
jgi:hypothetical protein